MLKMKKNLLKLTAIFGLSTAILNSCGSNENPPLVYFPDMYFPVAYDPLQKAEDAYSKHENEIPLFAQNNGATALVPVDGTVSHNLDGVIEANSSKILTPDEYNNGYDLSKSVNTSPLKTENQTKDIERGKLLYERTCSACHGNAGDGQGSIVVSGAYLGVPKFSDREISVGSIHYVLTNGRNAMGSYAGQLNPGDRWRVAMYVMNAFKGGLSTTSQNSNNETSDTETVASNK